MLPEAIADKLVGIILFNDDKEDDMIGWSGEDD